MKVTSPFISSAESWLANDAIMVPFLPSRIIFSICASLVAFCHAGTVKSRTPCCAKTALGVPPLPWQGAQLFAKTLAGSSAARGAAAAAMQ